MFLRLLLILAILPLWNRPLEAKPLLVHPEQTIEPKPLIDFVEFFEDEGRERTIAEITRENPEIVWRSIADQGVSIFDKGAFWLRLDLVNIGEAPVELFLEHIYAYTDRIELYAFDGNAYRLEGKRGDRVTYQANENPYRKPTFKITVPSGQNRYYIRLLTAGPMNPKFLIYSHDTFDRHVQSETLLLGLLFGFVTIMIGYNTFLALRLRNPSYFLYVAYILCFGLVQFIFTGLGKTLLPASPVTSYLLHWGIVPAAELTAIFGALFAISFLNLRSRSPWLYRSLLIFFTLSLANVVFSLVDYDSSVGLVLFTNGYVSLLLVWAGVNGCLQGYRPAFFYTVAWLFIIVGSLITMGQIYGFFPATSFTIWSQFIGGAIEVTLLSLALGDKMSLEQEKAHASISRLNIDLNHANAQLQTHIDDVEAIVEEKTRDIRSMLLNIRQGLFMVSSRDGRVMADYSRHLQAILGREDIEGTTVQDLLLANARLNSDQIDQTSAVLSSSLGNDVLNFEVNQNLLVKELIWVDRDGHEKVLEVDWSPVVDAQDHVEKILVTLRDVTDLRKLERQQAEQKRELEAIGQILALSAEKFASFLSTCQDFVKTCLDCLKQDPGLEMKTLNQIYINVHTMKGMARSYKFSDLAASFHDLESQLDRLRQGRFPGQGRHGIEDQLKKAFDLLHYFELINTQKLGRRSAQPGDVDGPNWIRQKIARLKALDIAALPQEQRLQMRRIIEDMEERAAISLEKALDDLQEGLPALAQQLGKPVPRVILHCNHLRLTHAGLQLAEKIFTHLFSNSLDHGIEGPEERQRKRKPRRGEIHIEAQLVGGRLLVTFEDDGAGLNLPHILSKAVEKGLFPAGARPDRKTVADLVFEPGFTTKDEASLVSGRGVGMDAVQTHLLNEQSTIELQLLDEGLKDPTTLSVIPFRFVISFAPHVCLAPRSSTRQVA